MVQTTRFPVSKHKSRTNLCFFWISNEKQETQLLRFFVALPISVQKGEFIVIGGASHGKLIIDFTRTTERCTLINDAIQCSAVGPALSNYYSYPEMMRVPNDYCPK